MIGKKNVILVAILLLLFLIIILMLIYSRVKNSSISRDYEPTLANEDEELFVKDKDSLGLDSKGWGQYEDDNNGMTKTWFNAVVVSSKKYNDEYLITASFESDGSESFFNLLIGKEDGKVGFYNPSDRSSDEAIWGSESISKVLEVLKPSTLFKFQLVIDIDAKKFNELLLDQNCDSDCLERMALVKSYYEINKEFAVAVQEDSDISDMVVGPALQIVIF